MNTQSSKDSRLFLKKNVPKAGKCPGNHAPFFLLLLSAGHQASPKHDVFQAGTTTADETASTTPCCTHLHTPRRLEQLHGERH